MLQWLGELAIRIRIAISSMPSGRSFTAILASTAARKVAIPLSLQSSAPSPVEVPRPLSLQQPDQAPPHHLLYLAALRHRPWYPAAPQHHPSHPAAPQHHPLHLAAPHHHPSHPAALRHRLSHRAPRHRPQPQVQRQAHLLLRHHPLVLQYHQHLCRHLPVLQSAGQITIPDILTSLGPPTTFDAVFNSRVTIFTLYTLTRSWSALIIAIFSPVAPQLPTLTVRPVPTQIVTRILPSEITTPIPPPVSIALCPPRGQRTIPFRTPHCALKVMAKSSRTCSEIIISSAATKTSKEAVLQAVRISEHTRPVPYIPVWSTATFMTRASASTLPAGPSRPTRLIAILNFLRERLWTKSGPRMLVVNEALFFFEISLFCFR